MKYLFARLELLIQLSIVVPMIILKYLVNEASSIYFSVGRRVDAAGSSKRVYKILLLLLSYTTLLPSTDDNCIKIKKKL